MDKLNYDEVCRIVGNLYLQNLHLSKETQRLQKEKEDALRLVADGYSKEKSPNQ